MDIFKTGRLTIRAVSSSDLDKLSPILSDETTMKYTATGAQTHEQMIAFVQNCARQYRENGFGHWAIFLTATNELVGLCGLNRHQIDAEEYVHVNYRLGSQYLGKGLATEAVNGVMDYCATSLNINDLSAIIEPSNINSIKVIERLGFKLIKQTMFKNLNVNIYQISV
ncbi:GNAT family N-acetyltransferase [Thalassomonas actiniarum]|uniref:GNAT family N-acetyltransferase n=1 Tax=Thalassomonas actiniarum TaxID=485447 RepID=A0AAF0C2P4_9GAMM|nr:GNAT family N-acetyltransferase [Thalassomonas actiniarum]WDD97869.1 GNAT family N-acetyltransferase [Thalassomonas actiniarum]